MPPLVSEGLNLALYGMGSVFVFLTLLVLMTMLMSWLVAPKKQSPLLRGRLIQLAPEKWLRSPQRSTCIETEHPHRLKFKF